MAKADQKLYRHLPYKFTKPQTKGLLEVEWNEFIAKEKRKHGGQLWAVIHPVIVYFNNTFLGTDEDFQQYIAHHFCFSLPIENIVYFSAMLTDYLACLRKTKRVYVSLDISIDESFIGSMLFQLYSDLLPATCGNFANLCTGEDGTSDEGIVLHYKGTLVHRIVKAGWIQCGDIENKIGGGGVSIYGPTFADESYCISHDRRGVLSMANDGKNSNASQFFITLNPSPWMDHYYVAFGQMVEGEEVLKAIEAVKTYYERPLQYIKIHDCGMLNLEEKKIKAKEPEIEKESEKADEKIREKLLQVPEDILDVRDAPSFLTEEGFLRGLYSYSVPDDLVKRALMLSEEGLGEDYVTRLLNFLVKRSVQDPSKLYETFPERISYARLIAEDLVRQALLVGDEYETTWDRKGFALQIAEEIVRRSMSYTDYESIQEKKVYVTQIAEEIVRKSILGPDYESYYDLQSFIQVITEEIVRKSMQEPDSYTDFFSYSAMIAHEVIKISDGEKREYYNVYEAAENVVSDVIAKAKEITETAIKLVDDILDTASEFVSIKLDTNEETRSRMKGILEHIVRKSTRGPNIPTVEEAIEEEIASYLGFDNTGDDRDPATNHTTKGTHHKETHKREQRFADDV